jgi:hypothetical protein
MKSHFNVSQIVNIVEFRFPRKYDNYTYVSEFKLFGVTITKEHISGFGIPNCSLEEFKKIRGDSHYVQDGIVYERIKVVTKFSNNQKLIAHFGSMEEMKKYVSDLKSKKQGWVKFNTENCDF